MLAEPLNKAKYAVLKASSAAQVSQISTFSGNDFIKYNEFNNFKVMFDTPDFFNVNKTIVIILNFTNCVPDRVPECYSEDEVFNVHVINDAPVIEEPT